MGISASPRPGQSDGVPHGWMAGRGHFRIYYQHVLFLVSLVFLFVALFVRCRHLSPLTVLADNSYTSDTNNVVSMHPLHPLILLLYCVLHSNLILASEDYSITSPYVVPLGFQPQPRRREDTKISPSSRRSTSNTCPSDYQQCGNGLPSDFCCSSDTSCISLDDNTSALCCPDGSGTCSSILPITCSLAVQNATAYPTSSVHTVNLDGELPTCGTDDSGTQTCCPFGYTCNGNSVCELTETETSVSTGVSATATTPPSSSSITTAITSSSACASDLILADPSYVLASPTPTTTSDEQSSHSSSRSKSIGIATGSAVAGVAAVAGFLIFAWMKRKRLKEKIQEKRRSITQRFSSTPPPLPPKDYQAAPRKKRKSILSWVPSVINRTPAELPATPVSYSAWNDQSGATQFPSRAHRPYPRDSMSSRECYELEARWLPQGVR